ncbi:MAG: hypothetical protein AAF696_36490, partial [Bacteroidota bacterium]
PENKWKRTISELLIEGNHIFINGKLGAELMSYFQFSGYPSYVFIDKEGKIDLNYIHSISKINIEDLKKRL